ncbi:MAG: MFS transporter [Dehalococcoidia bacterium]
MRPQSRLFYGWWIVAASVVGLSTSPGQFVFGSLGIFTLPMVQEFGWNRAETSLALTFFTVALAVTLPLVGKLVDRVGTRRVLLPSMLVVAGGLVLIPITVTELWQLYAVFALMGILGAGANNITYLRTISIWFDRNRGLALGLAVSGSGLGYAYMPLLVDYMIHSHGWRAGYWALAGVIVLVAFPVVALVLREAPQDVGLNPDGDRSDAGRGGDKAVPELHSTQKSILRTPVFWLLFGVFFLLSFSLFGLLIHLVPLLSDRGMSTAGAASVASVAGIAILASRIAIGFLIDRIFAPRVAFVTFSLSAIGIALLAHGVPDGAAYIVAILIGVSIGAEADLLAYLASRYFGLQSFGRIYGILFSSLLLGTATGPVAYGMGYERMGSYEAMLVLASSCCLVAAGVTTRLPPFPKEF